VKISLHLRATDTDAKQAHLQSQSQFDALLALMKGYEIEIESMSKTVTVTYDIEVVLSGETKEEEA
jgi:hypothetical protein